MRLKPLVIAAFVAGCVQQLPPPKEPSWPTLEPSPAPAQEEPTAESVDGPTAEPAALPVPMGGFPRDGWPSAMPGYNHHVVALRTTLGRAAIQLEMASPAVSSIRMTGCSDTSDKGCRECKLAGETDALDSAVLDAVKNAIDRYPTDVLEATHVDRVSLCRSLWQDGVEDRTTIGTVDLESRRLIISLAPYIGDRVYDADKYGTSTTEDTVHHELFHLFEYERMRAQYDDDPEWARMNPGGFEYNAQPTEGSELQAKPRRDGFVNTYARTNAVEDKASVYQLLMTHPDELCAMEMVDPIIRAKVDTLWKRIAAITDDAYLRRRSRCANGSL